MLLFSTVLKCTETLTPEKLIELVLEWNETSKYSENIVRGIDWKGERNGRYGDDRLWLSFADHTDQSILAIRHEKVSDSGVVWDSDFVLDYGRHSICIRLDRTYQEDMIVIGGEFSTPHIITLLIEKGYLEDDEGLPVLRVPVFVTDADETMIRSLFAGEANYKLPVVYVSKTADGSDPLSLAWLAGRLKGAAHILAEKSPEECTSIRSLGESTSGACGFVRIYFPSGEIRCKKITYRSMQGDMQLRLEKIIRLVIQYWVSQRVEPLYTWNGVSSAILNAELDGQMHRLLDAEKARAKAEDEAASIFDTFDEDLKALQEKVKALSQANEALSYENQGLRARLAGSDASPLIYSGEEDDYYPGEIRDFILRVIEDALSNTNAGTRQADVLADVLNSNEYSRLGDERKQKIKALFKGYRTLTGAMQQDLKELGIEISGDGKHYKLSYRGDARYMTTIPKTPSDGRSGSNAASIINNTMF